MATIDGIEYEYSKLSDLAKRQISSIRATDLEIERQSTVLSILKTARAAYSKALKSEIEKSP